MAPTGDGAVAPPVGDDAMTGVVVMARRDGGRPDDVPDAASAIKA